VEPALRGIIFNIQRYSIHDGPGIRTTVFFKGCPLNCSWCQNPESQRNEAEVFLIPGNCTLCGRCVAVCPTGANTLEKDSSAIERGKCIGCGKCVKVCPAEARKIVGAYVTTDEVMREVMKDMKFYENSGGGITLSGGDPTAQPEFALSILRSSKESGLHTVLDTCGYVAWSTMKRLLEYTDLVFFDIKTIDTKRHRAATGRSNRLILENAKRIAGYKPMRVRVPVIPNFNDSPEDVRATARFVRKELGDIEMDLLPYNKLGEVKYERLGKTPFIAEAQSDEEMYYLETVASTELKRTS
jgi:pyruvate formate lyase activating enzyme